MKVVDNSSLRPRVFLAAMSALLVAVSVGALQLKTDTHQNDIDMTGLGIGFGFDETDLGDLPDFQRDSMRKTPPAREGEITVHFCY